MAISASGFYGPTLEKIVTNAAAISLEAEDNKIALVTDSYNPDFNAHDFFADVTNEVSGTGYTAGGKALTGTEVTVASGVMTWTASNPSWAGSTITSAMAAIIYADAVADELVFLIDFVTAASTSAGAFTVQINAAGIAVVDFTP